MDWCICLYGCMYIHYHAIKTHIKYHANNDAQSTFLKSSRMRCPWPACTRPASHAASLDGSPRYFLCTFQPLRAVVCMQTDGHTLRQPMLSFSNVTQEFAAAYGPDMVHLATWKTREMWGNTSDKRLLQIIITLSGLWVPDLGNEFPKSHVFLQRKW